MRLLFVFLGLLTLTSVSAAQISMSAARLNPNEIEAIVPVMAGAGTSGLAGIRTLYDPTVDPSEYYDPVTHPPRREDRYRHLRDLEYRLRSRVR